MSSGQVARRAVLRAASLAGLGWLTPRPAAADAAPSQEDELVRQVAGGPATLSPRVHLDMPLLFGNGYSVPMKLSVDSPMTDSDHVRLIHVVAPQNPITLVARFAFTPACGRAEIATRIRLAKPQNVLAIAEMADGTRLLARRFVTVQTDGCA